MTESASNDHYSNTEADAGRYARAHAEPPDDDYEPSDYRPDTDDDTEEHP